MFFLEFVAAVEFEELVFDFAFVGDLVSNRKVNHPVYKIDFRILTSGLTEEDAFVDIERICTEPNAFFEWHVPCPSTEVALQFGEQ